MLCELKWRGVIGLTIPNFLKAIRFPWYTQHIYKAVAPIHSRLSFRLEVFYSGVSRAQERSSFLRIPLAELHPPTRWHSIFSPSQFDSTTRESRLHKPQPYTRHVQKKKYSQIPLRSEDRNQPINVKTLQQPPDTVHKNNGFSSMLTS